MQPPHGRARPGRRAADRRGLRGQVLDRDVEARAPRSAARAPPRKRATGAASSVADIATSCRSGRAVRCSRRSSASARSPCEVPLVELVEHDRADAGQRGVAEEPAREHALGDEADARARPRDLLEPDLVADRLARPLAELLGDAARGEPRREPPRLEHHDLAVAEEPRLEERARHARRLPRAGRRLEDEPTAPARRAATSSGRSGSMGSGSTAPL